MLKKIIEELPDTLVIVDGESNLISLQKKRQNFVDVIQDQLLTLEINFGEVSNIIHPELGKLFVQRLKLDDDDKKLYCIHQRSEINEDVVEMLDGFEDQLFYSESRFVSKSLKILENIQHELLLPLKEVEGLLSNSKNLIEENLKIDISDRLNKVISKLENNVFNQKLDSNHEIALEPKIQLSSENEVEENFEDFLKKSKLKAVVVDDDHNYLTLSTYILEELGLEVSCGLTGEDCMDILKLDQDFDVIFTDIVMPQMDGHELVRRLSSTEKFKDIPIIVCTSLNIPEELEKFIQDGAKAWIIKPITRDNVLKALNEVIKIPHTQNSFT